MKLMSKTAFKKTLEDWAYTHEQIAKQLDLNPRQIRRYVSGDAPIPRVVELALRYLTFNQEA